MTRLGWKKKIIENMTIAGTYDEVFDPVIETLVDILVERDRIYKQYVKEGSHPLVTVVSDRGAENQRKNPLISAWQEMNRDALQYWRDLGLTPAGLKKIDEKALDKESLSGLDKLLAQLEG